LGLFDRFVGSREERDLKRIRDLQKKAEEQYGDATSRAKAIEQLREIGSPESIAALLHKFTVKVEPGITDAEEKERVFGIVTDFGEVAVQPVREFLKAQDSISWGLRCLEALVTSDEAIGTITGLLAELSRSYTRTPEKKVLLIRWLASHEDPRIAPAVKPLLDDAFDDVKIAAMETLVSQRATDARDPLVERMLHDEAPRVRQAAAAALADLGVPVGDRKKDLEGKVPAGYRVAGDKLVRG
jgi:HEAT repeat protein